MSQTTLIKPIIAALTHYATPARARVSATFFKTGPGQYGEGDTFLGVRVPDIRAVAKQWYTRASFDTLSALIQNPYHEVRALALIMLTLQCNRASLATRALCYEWYLAHRSGINNWDLVDVSAPIIVGEYLYQKGLRGKSVVTTLAPLIKSHRLWDRRIAMLATFAFIKHSLSEEAFMIAKLLMRDTEDLMHKAVGWMLREVGKQVSERELALFLDAHVAHLPRTSLRYAIERMPREKQLHYLRQ